MPACKEWLMKQWANVYRLKHDGILVIGFTWYSLTHEVDWDSVLRNDDGIVNKLGLYDLDRKIMPVGKAYKKLIEQRKIILRKKVMASFFTIVDLAKNQRVKTTSSLMTSAVKKENRSDAHIPLLRSSL